MPAVPRARYRTKLGPSDLTFHQLDMASIASFSHAGFLGLDLCAFLVVSAILFLTQI